MTPFDELVRAEAQQNLPTALRDAGTDLRRFARDIELQAGAAVPQVWEYIGPRELVDPDAPELGVVGLEAAIHVAWRVSQLAGAPQDVQLAVDDARRLLFGFGMLQVDPQEFRCGAASHYGFRWPVPTRPTRWEAADFAAVLLALADRIDPPAAAPSVPEPAHESPSAPPAQDERAPWLGIRLSLEPRTVRRDGIPKTVDLSGKRTLWPLLVALVDAGETGIVRDQLDAALPEQLDAGANVRDKRSAAIRQNVSRLRTELIPLELSINEPKAGEPWKLVADA